MSRESGDRDWGRSGDLVLVQTVLDNLEEGFMLIDRGQHICL